MARNLGLDDVVDHFTLVGDEVDQLRNKAGATRLGFALTLKFLLWRGRFPRGRHELADDAVDHVARQVGVAAREFGSYDMTSRTGQRHRTEIRRYTGFRECSVADAEKLALWLAGHVAESERRGDRVRDELLARCRGELIEPPSADRVTEIVRSALRQAEQTLVTRVASRIDSGAIGRLEGLVAVYDDPDDDHPDVLATIKTDPRHPGGHRLCRGHPASLYPGNATHPVYQAMLELGRAQRTIFVCRYLRDRDLQREIEEGLNVVESWNRVNAVIFFGKSGEFATNRRDQQELGMVALHILQAAIVYVNTLMVQEVLALPEWGRAHRRRQARADTAVLEPHPALRRGEAEHGPPARTQWTHATGPGRGGLVGGVRPSPATCRLVPASLTGGPPTRFQPDWPGPGCMSGVSLGGGDA